MFKRVPRPGQVEPFLAVKSMQEGDIIVLHVGKMEQQSHISNIGKNLNG